MIRYMLPLGIKWLARGHDCVTRSHAWDLNIWNPGIRSPRFTNLHILQKDKSIDMITFKVHRCCESLMKNERANHKRLPVYARCPYYFC